MPADFETRFLTGIAELLHAATSGTWRSSGSYTANEVGIVLDTIPQSPAGVIVLAVYGVDDDPSLSDSMLGLQVTTRRDGQDPRPGNALAGEVFDQLHGLHDVDLTLTDIALGDSVHLVHCLRRSHTSIGQDQNGRWRRVQNFYCDVHRPSPHRQ